MLNPAEAWFLIVLGDEGKFWGEFDFGLEYQLRGAALMELAVRGKIVTEPQGSESDEPYPFAQLRILDPTPTGELALDTVLAELQGHMPTAVTDVFLKIGDPERNVAAGLVSKGLVSEEEKKRLVFTSSRYFITDPSQKMAVRARLDAALVGARPDVRTAALVALVYCGLSYSQLLLFFEKKQIRSGQFGMSHLMSVEPYGFFTPLTSGDGAISADLARTLNCIYWELLNHPMAPD